MKRRFPPLALLLLSLWLAPLTAQGQSPGAWADQIVLLKEGAPGKKAKIFLVASSAQNANFAKEVLDQRDLWLKAGFSEEEIACYAVVPIQENFRKDRRQFSQIAAGLKHCFPASVKRLREDLARAAKGKPDFLYLYWTTHGQKPIKLKLEETDIRKVSYPYLRRLARHSALDQYQLSTEALPDGTAHSYEILGALRSGVDPEELLMTPKYLREFLGKKFKKTPKILVLQACFSGGFLEDARPGREEDSLTRLKNITVLTAARYDRESFGCQAAAATTYYGGLFNELLGEYLQNPLQIPWAEFQEKLKAKVDQIESKEGIKPSSLPQYFSNFAAEDL